MVHYLDQALRANVAYKRDIDYIVKEQKVIIIDPFTGRMMEGRRWSEGLTRAVEAKEGKTEPENRDYRLDHLPELFPYVPEAGRDDRHNGRH